MSSEAITETPDDELVARFQRGDRPAFEEIVRRHRGKVYAVALRVTRNEQEALEIVQDTFLSAFKKLPDFRGDAALGSWLHRIALNYALMRLRHKKVVGETEEPLETTEGKFRPDGHWDELPTGSWGRRADDLFLDSELRAKINEAVDALPDAYRAVFFLRDVEGLTYEEIAEAVDTTIPAIKSRLHRARLALRERLAGYFDARES